MVDESFSFVLIYQTHVAVFKLLYICNYVVLIEFSFV